MLLVFSELLTCLESTDISHSRQRWNLKMHIWWYVNAEMKWGIETLCDFCNIPYQLRVRHFIKTVCKSSSFRNYQRKSPDSWPQGVSRIVLIFFPKGSKKQNLVICSSACRCPCQQMMWIWKGETGQALERYLLRALKQTNCIRLGQALEPKPVWD